MSASVRIIVIRAKTPDDFESISPRNRKSESRGWKELALRSDRYLCTFLQKATEVDLGVFGCEDGKDPEGPGALRTRLVTNGGIRKALTKLASLVEETPDETAQALLAHAGGKGDARRIAKALASGSWPAKPDVAVEAAAFAHHLLVKMRTAQEKKLGVCWEYRGKMTV